MFRVIAIAFTLVSLGTLAWETPNEAASWRWSNNTGTLDTTNHATKELAGSAVCTAAGHGALLGLEGHVGTSIYTAGNPGINLYYNPNCEAMGAGYYNGAQIIYQMARCPAGSPETASGGVMYCIPSNCVANQGKEADSSVTWVGPMSDVSPVSSCIDGCVAKFISGARFDMTLADGTNYNSYKGITVLGLVSCTGQHAGVTQGAWRGTSAPGYGNITGIGGIGSAGGGGQTVFQGFNGMDAVNLAKIATNTSRTVDALTSMGVGTGGSTCGGTSQPACATSAVEGNTATSDSNTVANLTASETSVVAGFQGSIDALGASAPSMLPGGGRWTFSLASFLPASSCELSGGTMMVGGTPVSLSMSVCTWGHYVSDFLSWAFMLLTTWGVWSTLFASRGT